MGKRIARGLDHAITRLLSRSSPYWSGKCCHAICSTLLPKPVPSCLTGAIVSTTTSGPARSGWPAQSITRTLRPPTGKPHSGSLSDSGGTAGLYCGRLLAGVGMGVMLVIAAAVPQALAEPDPEPDPGFDDRGQDCQIDPVGTLFCDGPLRADGSWTRCISTPLIIWGGRPLTAMPSCEDYGPDHPPGPGQPPHYIDDGP